MAGKDFYTDMDLRYPEIAVCIERIDRVNPGTKKFYIPVLTPNVDTTSLKTKDNIVYQTNSNIANEQSVSISNVTVSNYIEMTIPRELCGYVGGKHKIKGQGKSIFQAIKLALKGSTNISGTGTVGPADSYSVLSVSGARLSSMDVNGTGNDEYTNEALEEFDPVERYIEKGSKWIVVFIGGDINQPQIIARYTDPV